MPVPPPTDDSFIISPGPFPSLPHRINNSTPHPEVLNEIDLLQFYFILLFFIPVCPTELSSSLLDLLDDD